MAWKFIHIGKANAEIDRLTARVAEVEKERDDARSALEANGSDIAKHAEELQGQLDTANTSVQSVTAENTALKGQVAAKDKEIASLKQQVEGSAQQVQIKIAQGVAAAQASIGTAPAPAVPAAAAEAPKNLTGIDRIRASAGKDLQTYGYEKK